MFKTPSSKFKLASSVDCGPIINSGLAMPLPTHVLLPRLSLTLNVHNAGSSLIF